MTSMIQKAVVVAVLILGVGSLAACGDSGTPAPTPPGTTTSAPATAPSTGTTSPPTTTTGTTTPRTTAATTDGTGTAPGTSFGGEDLSAEQATELQQSVDQGHQPWRLEQTMVAETFVLSRFGWDSVDARLADPHTAEVTNRADGKMVVLQLRQPAREGEGGIWAVVSGVWIN